MIKTFDIAISDDLRNATEAKYYEAEVSARNSVIALSRADNAADPFSTAFLYNWDRLVKFAKEYEDQKDIISDTVVKPELEKRGIKTNTSWNLNFDSKILTVTYDDSDVAEDDTNKTIVTIDCPEEFVAPVASASATLNAYDSILSYISRNNGAGVNSNVIGELDKRQTAAYKDFITNRQAVEDNVVKPYLNDQNITDRVTWELKYSTRKIRIIY